MDTRDIPNRRYKLVEEIQKAIDSFEIETWMFVDRIHLNIEVKENAAENCGTIVKKIDISM